MKILYPALPLLLAPLISAAALSRETKVSYDGYKVFRISTHHDPQAVKDQVAALSSISLNLDDKEHLDLAIAPHDIAAFEAMGLETQIMHEDLGADIEREMAHVEYPAGAMRAIPGLDWFNSYHPYDDHIQYFNDLHAAFESNSEIISAGSSYEGRNIYGIHMWGSGGKGSKPAVYFHGTVHAREWISAMVVEYLTYQLIDGYGNDDEVVKAVLDSYDFYIFPFVNPDGFVYSQTHDRLWRKNRQPRPGASCVGTDINRNWPYKWSLPGGASTSTCSETYKGEAAADTTEMASLLSFTKTLSSSDQGIKLYIDWHSYGQYILYPWGFDCSLAAPNETYQDELAGNLAGKIAESFGTEFTYGGSCGTLYATTGDSTDYMAGEAGAELAWTIELRPSGWMGGGFVLPPEMIKEAAEEEWQGMRYLLAIM